MKNEHIDKITLGSLGLALPTAQFVIDKICHHLRNEDEEADTND